MKGGEEDSRLGEGPCGESDPSSGLDHRDEEEATARQRATGAEVPVGGACVGV